MSFWSRVAAWFFPKQPEPPFWEDFVKSMDPDYKPHSGWNEHMDGAPSPYGSGLWNVTTEYHPPKKPKKPKVAKTSQEEKWRAIDEAQIVASAAEKQKPKKAKKKPVAVFSAMNIPEAKFGWEQVPLKGEEQLAKPKKKGK